MFFIMLIGAITWHVLQPREPSYQRRRLTEWLNDYNGAGSMTRIEPTDQAIRAMGTNHLPYLLAHIEHTEAPDTYKRQAMAWAGGFVKLPFYAFGPVLLYLLPGLACPR